VSQITGVARSTIGRGLVELRGGETTDPDRVRRPGGGRKPLTTKDATLLDDLRRLVEPSTRGDPEGPLLWTAKSLRKLAAGLRELGHQISYTLVGDLLRALGYSLQANRKTREGGKHPDRDAQFGYINEKVKAALAAGEPAISVDTKKKELVGDFKNAGREWRPRGSPEPVRVHDFIIPELGRAVPYGVYDIAENAGWVSVGIGTRVRLWKVELQRIADELGLEITVCHLPPGTSKWNKIEHRLFSFITQNWRGKPLVSHRVIVQLIAATTTIAGLKVHAEIDPNPYPAASRSPRPNSPPSTSPAMISTASGTIQSPPKRSPWSDSCPTGA
jgi:transposase